MTVKELSQLHHLQREIEMNNARFLSIDPNNCTEAVAKLRGTLEESLKHRVTEHERLFNYIEAIPDSLTRTIFTLRFVAGLDERQTAEYLGGKYSAATVQQRVKRYLKKANARTENKQNAPQVAREV